MNGVLLLVALLLVGIISRSNLIATAGLAAMCNKP